MKTTTLLLSALLLAGSLLFASSCFAADYYVYCVKGKGSEVSTLNFGEFTNKNKLRAQDVHRQQRVGDKQAAEAFARNEDSDCRKMKR